MNFRHYTHKHFWRHYKNLPKTIQQTADKQYKLLLANPRHSSLQLKKVGRFWSARVNDTYRALAIKTGNDFIWFWIGEHDEYNRLWKS